MRVDVDSYVNIGDPICVLSAMKMETVVGSTFKGKVEQVYVAESDSLSAGDLICKIAK